MERSESFMAGSVMDFERQATVECCMACAGVFPQAAYHLNSSRTINNEDVPDCVGSRNRMQCRRRSISIVLDTSMVMVLLSQPTARNCSA